MNERNVSFKNYNERIHNGYHLSRTEYTSYKMKKNKAEQHCGLEEHCNEELRCRQELSMALRTLYFIWISFC